MPCQVTFNIIEADKHLQKNYDFYKVGRRLVDKELLLVVAVAPVVVAAAVVVLVLVE